MTPKFKKGEELRSLINFKKVIVEKIDISISSVSEPNEKTKICYWNKLDGEQSSSIGHYEEFLSPLDCTKSLLKAKEILSQGNFSIKIFTENNEENRLVEESLKNKIQREMNKHIEECIKNIID
jgi:hypothetical protein